MMNKHISRHSEGKVSVWLAVFVVSMLIASVFIIIGRNSELRDARSRADEASILPERPEQILAIKDSDDDGLKDWEEELYDTNPYHPDTDLDGTNDGEEIATSRDPLRAGPADKITIEDTRPSIIPKSQKKNLTDELSSLFAQKYLQDKLRSETAFDPQAIVENLTNTLFQSGAIDYPVIDRNNLIIITNNSATSIKTYFNAYSTLLEKNLASATGSNNPMLIITNIRKLDDLQNEIVKFEPIIAQYQITYQELIKLSVPSEWVEYHERGLNILLAHITLMREARSSESDIIKLITVLDQFGPTLLDLNLLRNDISNALRLKNIKFGPEEPAYRVLQLS